VTLARFLFSLETLQVLRIDVDDIIKLVFFLSSFETPLPEFLFPPE